MAEGKETIVTIIFEPATTPAMAAAAHCVREEVFGREWNRSLTRLSSNPAETITLIARTEKNAHPIAALTVVDTTMDSELHERFALPFESGVRVARYTRLAVLKPYRGLNIPLQFILEARRRFITTANVRYTWLLFDAERAISSKICGLLGFHVSEQTFHTEYGVSRVLWRNESDPEACLRDEDAQEFLRNSRPSNGRIALETDSFASKSWADQGRMQGLAQWLTNHSHLNGYAIPSA
jgi:hypothetical protein